MKILEHHVLIILMIVWLFFLKSHTIHLILIILGVALKLPMFLLENIGELKTKKFSNKENFEIEQRLILSTIKSLTELMSNKLKFVLLLIFFLKILYNFAKSFLYYISYIENIKNFIKKQKLKISKIYI